MAKGDDALAKKKNKAIRKRNRRAGAGTTEAIEGVQSHKRRRKAGTRRVCEVFAGFFMFWYIGNRNLELRSLYFPVSFDEWKSAM